MKDVYRITLTNGEMVEVKTGGSPASSIEYGHALIGELVDNGKVMAHHFYVNPRHIVTAAKVA